MQSDGNTLNGWMLKPAGFDPSRRYPVVMYRYSGPGSQEVLNNLEHRLGQLLHHPGLHSDVSMAVAPEAVAAHS